MINSDLFETIKQKHGGYSSWAVWADQIDKPKSNMGDMSIFNAEHRTTLLNQLKNNVIMVGLNISRSFSEPFRNFHDFNPRANDFKIRFAFRNTEYYGAYMTDIIKEYEMVDSKNVITHLKDNNLLVTKSIEKFREEIKDLKSDRPIIFAFGVTAYKILKNNIHNTEYGRLIKLTHYSHQISKEAYKETILREIEIGMG
jgi:hypothetical protein